MGIRHAVLIGALVIVAELPAAAERQHYDDLGLWLEPPGDMALTRDDMVHGAGPVDGVFSTVLLLTVSGDWSDKPLADLEAAAVTLPGADGTALATSTRSLHGHLVVSEVWEAKDTDARFETVLFPTASALLLLTYGTPKADFDASAPTRDAFFRDGVGFDAGAPGIPESPLLTRLRTAGSGLAGWKTIADTKVKVVTPSSTVKIVRKKVTQARWDEQVAPLFADLASGAPATCDDALRRCTVTSASGAEIEYRFGKGKKPRLREIRLPSSE
jgi:hypothetical protein